MAIKLFADAMADSLMQRYGSTLLNIRKPSLPGESPLPATGRAREHRAGAPARADPGRTGCAT
jgi:phospholipid transport system substrate-binding protein